MAKISGQSIPPSLAAQFNQIITPPHDNRWHTVTTNVNRKVYAAQPTHGRQRLLRIFHNAPTWIAEQWAHKAGHEISGGYLAQRKNLMDYIFEPPYWRQATVIADYVEYGVPVVSAYTDEINPAYNDPLRQPSTCTYSTPTNTYATPAGHGTPSQPGPGWAGEVSGGIYRDLWFAQRVTKWAMPTVGSSIDNRPIIIKLDSTVTANASFRGVKSWYYRSIFTRFYSHNTENRLPPPYIITKWKRDYKLAIALPGDETTGWNHTDTRTMLFDAREAWAVKFTGYVDRMKMVITSPPGRGRYFGRNDAISVWHDSNPEVFVGMAPND